MANRTYRGDNADAPPANQTREENRRIRESYAPPYDLTLICEKLRDVRSEVNECCDELERREIRRYLNDIGDFDGERLPPDDIVEICAALRKLPHRDQPLAFESGAPDGFGPLWLANARDVLDGQSATYECPIHGTMAPDGFGNCGKCG